MPEDLEGGRIYLAWGRFLLAVAVLPEPEADLQFPLDCEVGISGTQSSKRFSNQPYGVLNHV